MSTKEAGLGLLNDPVAQELLHSTNMAKLAYNWKDGTPRVVPIWFHWTGKEIVVVSPAKAPKVRAVLENSPVAITIDRNEWPYHALIIRGTAHVSTVEGVAAEYTAAAQRYFGPEQGTAWSESVGKMSAQTVRIAVEPESIHIIDMETRFPSAIASAMAGQQ